MHLAEEVLEQGRRATPLGACSNGHRKEKDPGTRPTAEASQPYQALWRRLVGCANGAPAASRTLGLTSCASGEGVSTVAAGLAVAAAAAGQPVLLVDANLERPCQHRLFHLGAGPGLSEALRGMGRPLDHIQPSPVHDLSVLVAGQAGSDPALLHDHDVLGVMIATLKDAFPLVVFDLPATSQISFTMRLAGLLDGVLLVVETERTRAELVQREKDLLAQAGTAVLGAVLNKRRQYVPAWLRRFL